MRCGEPVKEGECWNPLLIYVLRVVLVLTERGGAATRLSHLDAQTISWRSFNKDRIYNTQLIWTSIYWTHARTCIFIYISSGLTKISIGRLKRTQSRDVYAFITR